MAPPFLKLSVLDQSPAAQGESATVALQHTIALAQHAEAWGYHRYWVTEHHGSPRLMGSSPEVLVSHLLARTERIRIGSGGVMLQHYSPYKVAENFNVLASLAPGRVDLGIGRGPGGMPQTTAALRPQPTDGVGQESLEEKLVEAAAPPERSPGRGRPGRRAGGLAPSQPTGRPVPAWRHYAASAQVAAEMNVSYVFALFLNGDEAEMRSAMATYRQLTNDAQGWQPGAILALPVIVADREEVAANIASAIRAVRVRLASGRTFTLFSEEAAREFGRQTGEDFTYEVQPANMIHGTPGKVKARLLDIQQEFGVNEVFIVTTIDDFDLRLRSYQLLSETML